MQCLVWKKRDGSLACIFDVSFSPVNRMSWSESAEHMRELSLSLSLSLFLSLPTNLILPMPFQKIPKDTAPMELLQKKVFSLSLEETKKRNRPLSHPLVNQGLKERKKKIEPHSQEKKFPFLCSLFSFLSCHEKEREKSKDRTRSSICEREIQGVRQ